MDFPGNQGQDWDAIISMRGDHCCLIFFNSDISIHAKQKESKTFSNVVEKYAGNETTPKTICQLSLLFLLLSCWAALLGGEFSLPAAPITTTLCFPPTLRTGFSNSNTPFSTQVEVTYPVQYSGGGIFFRIFWKSPFLPGKRENKIKSNLKLATVYLSLICRTFCRILKRPAFLN